MQKIRKKWAISKILHCEPKDGEMEAWADGMTDEQSQVHGTILLVHVQNRLRVQKKKETL